MNTHAKYQYCRHCSINNIPYNYWFTYPQRAYSTALKVTLSCGMQYIHPVYKGPSTPFSSIEAIFGIPPGTVFYEQNHLRLDQEHVPQLCIEIKNARRKVRFRHANAYVCLPQEAEHLDSLDYTQDLLVLMQPIYT